MYKVFFNNGSPHITLNDIQEVSDYIVQNGYTQINGRDIDIGV